jgi:hypothetical protein
MQYPVIFLERLWKTTEDVRLTGVVAKIRTEHFANTSPERYCYTSLVGASVCYKLFPLLHCFHYQDSMESASCIVWF